MSVCAGHLLIDRHKMFDHKAITCNYLHILSKIIKRVWLEGFHIRENALEIIHAKYLRILSTHDFLGPENHMTLSSGITNCANHATWSSYRLGQQHLCLEQREEIYVRCKAAIKFILKS